MILFLFFFIYSFQLLIIGYYKFFVMDYLRLAFQVKNKQTNKHTNKHEHKQTQYKHNTNKQT